MHGDDDDDIYLTCALFAVGCFLGCQVRLCVCFCGIFVTDSSWSVWLTSLY